MPPPALTGEATLPSPRAGRSRNRVLLVDPLDEAAVAELHRRHDLTVRLRPAPPELRDLARDAHVIVCRSGVRIDRAVLDAAACLRLVVRAGSGTDNIEIETARARGVVVATVPALSATSVAEHALALLFSLARRVPEADRQVRDGLWRKASLTGVQLRGRTLGLLGLGSIGQRLAELARGIGMSTVATVAQPDPRRGEQLAEQGVELLALPEMLTRVDALSLQLPLTARTRGLIGRPQLAAMRPGALVVDVGRAGILDEDALFEALTSGHLGGAALDVHRAESGVPRFAALDNVVLTPHLGAMTPEAQQAIGHSVVTAVEAWSTGAEVPHRVT